MTQAQWMRSTGDNPSVLRAGEEIDGRKITGTHPVEHTKYGVAVWGLETVGLLLPTEAQWEKAARGGTRSPWYTGSRPGALTSHANLRGPDDGHLGHAPVGSFLPNPFGLHDICGNVVERCRDPYHKDAYTKITARSADGLRLVRSNGTRVVRGGGFWDEPNAVRSAARGHGNNRPFVGIRPLFKVLLGKKGEKRLREFPK